VPDIVEKIVRKSRKNARVVLDNGQNMKIPSSLAVVGADLSDFLESKHNFDTKSDLTSLKKNNEMRETPTIKIFQSREYDVSIRSFNELVFYSKLSELEKQGYRVVYYSLIGKINDVSESETYYAELKKA